jgi:hypothetical protein
MVKWNGVALLMPYVSCVMLDVERERCIVVVVDIV